MGFSLYCIIFIENWSNPKHDTIIGASCPLLSFRKYIIFYYF